MKSKLIDKNADYLKRLIGEENVLSTDAEFPVWCIHTSARAHTRNYFDKLQSFMSDLHHEFPYLYISSFFEPTVYKQFGDTSDYISPSGPEPYDISERHEFNDGMFYVADTPLNLVNDMLDSSYPEPQDLVSKLIMKHDLPFLIYTEMAVNDLWFGGFNPDSVLLKKHGEFQKFQFVKEYPKLGDFLGRWFEGLKTALFLNVRELSEFITAGVREHDMEGVRVESEKLLMAPQFPVEALGQVTYGYVSNEHDGRLLASGIKDNVDLLVKYRKEELRLMQLAEQTAVDRFERNNLRSVTRGDIFRKAGDHSGYSSGFDIVTKKVDQVEPMYDDFIYVSLVHNNRILDDEEVLDQVVLRPPIPRYFSLLETYGKIIFIAILVIINIITITIIYFRLKNS